MNWMKRHIIISSRMGNSVLELTHTAPALANLRFYHVLCSSAHLKEAERKTSMRGWARRLDVQQPNCLPPCCSGEFPYVWHHPQTDGCCVVSIATQSMSPVASPVALHSTAGIGSEPSKSSAHGHSKTGRAKLSTIPT
jgi:hypothetical protein